MTKDKAAKVITKEINTRAKLNTADKYLKKKKENDEFIKNIKTHSLEELEMIFKRVMQYITKKDYISNQSNAIIDKMNKDELINKIINLRGKKTIPYKYFDLSIPFVSDIAHYNSSNNSKRKGRKKYG